MSAELRLRIGWICLLIVSVGVLVFGVVVAFASGGVDAALYRADGLASAGLGLFGVMIVAVPYRRRERWAWVTLWFFPLFWAAHLFGDLPPGKDHIHQVVFIVLSVAGLLLPAGEFLRSRGSEKAAR